MTMPSNETICSEARDFAWVAARTPVARVAERGPLVATRPHHIMKPIPTTESAQIIRTDFSDQAAWESLTAAVREPPEPFIFNMEILDERERSGAAVEQLLAALPEDYPHSFLVVADSVAMSQPGHPMLVIDLMEERGRQFRALAAQVPSIENNLSLANMGFEEFADALDEGGVFRGFPEM